MKLRMVGFCLLLGIQVRPALAGFELFTVEHGLSHNLINALVQDSTGYLWAATPDGITRYDGYSFVQYRHDYSDTNSLPANFVGTMFVDRKGRVWAGTFNGLCRFEPRRNGFVRYRLQARLTGAIPECVVYAIHEDSGNRLWVATDRGLFVVDEEKTEMVLPHLPDSTLTLLDKIAVACFASDPDPRSRSIWLGTSATGLIRLDTENGLVSRIHASRMGLPHGNIVRSMVSGTSADGRRVLWALISNMGIVEIILNGSNVDSAEVRPVRFPDLRLPVAEFWTLMQDSRGSLWVSTRGGAGVLEITSSESGILSTIHHAHDPRVSRSISNNNVNSILEDRSGNIWFGTNGGLNKLNRRQRQIKHLIPDVPQGKEQWAPAFRNITCLYEDMQGTVWVGNIAGQLLRYDEKSVPAFSPFPRAKEVLRGGVVTAIHELNSAPDILWIGTGGSGVIRLNTSTGETTRFLHSPTNPNTLSSNVVNAIADDGLGRLWIGTNNGLNMLDPESGNCARYVLKRSVSTSDSLQLLSNSVWTILRDRKSTQPVLWIGTIGGWMSRLDVGSGTFIHLTDSTTPALHNRSITTLLQDSTGVLWIGTYSGGLKRLDPLRQVIADFTMNEGLSNNMIQGILQDEQGLLWLSTNNGISRLNPLTEEVLTLDVSDGLQYNQFNRGVCVKGAGGALLFGGPNGFNRFHPDSISLNRRPPAVVLSGMEVVGEQRTPPADGVSGIILDHTENFLSFDFLAIDLTNPRKNRYVYKLEGVDERWVQSGTRHNAAYAHLSPGQYTFRVKAANSDGVWNDEGLALAIVIRPPFWRTWWFLSGTVALLAGAIAFSYNWRIKSHVKRELEIGRIREEEREIVRIKTARDFHDEMGHRLTRINMLSETATRKLAQSPTEVRELLDAIRDNADHLFNGTRDFIWSLDSRNDSLFDLVVRLKDFGDELFFKTGVAFEAKGITEDFHSVRLTLEVRRQLMLIFKEAMTNCARHAHATRIELEFRIANGTLHASLLDDGVGFREGSDDPGTGMTSMQARAQKIGGILNVGIGSTHGTRVSFSGPLVSC
ncbi:MAG: two-component regulator propeller domain-containing protein [Bacteroidota bacterium]